jgi:hypothetical protein
LAYNPKSIADVRYKDAKFLPINQSNSKEVLIMSRYAEVKAIVDGLEKDFAAFYEKNNKAAGTRVRKGMQELKDLAQEIRKEVQEKKNEAE